MTSNIHNINDKTGARILLESICLAAGHPQYLPHLPSSSFFFLFSFFLRECAPADFRMHADVSCEIPMAHINLSDIYIQHTRRTHLYLAGRLHKPVLAVTPGGGGGAGSASAVEASLAANHAAAARSAALLLPETFTELDFYTAICGLSYAGDFRMVVGENKNKVQNIVAGQIDLLKPLYAPHIEEMSSWVGDRNGSGSSSSGSGSSSGGEDGGGGRIFARDLNPETTAAQLLLLPAELRKRLAAAAAAAKDSNTNSAAAAAGEARVEGTAVEDEQLAEDEVWAAELATKGIYGEQIMQGLTSIVGGSSKTQSAVGILSAGLLKSVKYGSAKLGKMWEGRTQR